MSQAPDAPYDPYDQPPTFIDKHRDWIWAAGVFIATILLTVLAYPPNFPEFGYAFAVPAIFWAYMKPDFKLYAGTMAAAQMIAWTVMLGWLHHVTWFGLLLLGPFVGLWVGVWYLAAWWTMSRMVGRPTINRLVIMLGLAALWVVLEWTRNWFLTGFPWMPLAATQWKMVSMLQIAAYTGSGGISFVIMVVNIAFAAYAHRLFREGARGFNKRSQEFFFALFLVLACFCLFLVVVTNRKHFTQPLARIAFVQPYIPQAVKWDEAKAPQIMQTIEELTLRAGATNPDLILWPEAVTPYAVKGMPAMQKWTENLVVRARVPVLMGSVEVANPNTPQEIWRNGAFVIDPENGLLPTSYAKRHLVPFGEYVPLRPLFGWLKKFTEVSDGDFTPGNSSATMLVKSAGGAFTIGSLVCYEDIFPNLARQSVLDGADVLAVVTNNAWYGEGGAAYQHAAHSVLRAVELRRPVLRCGNGGWSGWIDEYGNICAELKRLPDGVITTKVKHDPADKELDAGSVYFRGTATVNVSYDNRFRGTQSFYAEHGDWFVSFCAGLACFAYYVALVSKVAKKPAGEE
ncbi:MAG: apolipoprotein N-acyltransferase [Nibricoccus sp.]